MVWHILRYWISFFLPAFYKRIQAKNLHHILTDGPVIIAMNHPNAFTDPILITSLTHPLKLKYLARGDAFKPGFVSWVLESIGIVPIFRIQDGGKEGLKKNEDAYRRVNYLLSKNSKIIVFAEGLCIQERRLRPLKKGVARMVFGAYEALKNDKLRVVPIGVNYFKPDRFRSTAFYNIGEPIMVKDFMEEYSKSPARANNIFLQTLEPKMKELVTHIEDKNYDETVVQAEKMFKKKMILAKGLDPSNLEHDFIVLNEITETINRAARESNPALPEFKQKAAKYFSELKQHKVKDWLFDPDQNRNVNLGMLLVRVFFLGVGLPLFIIGLVGNYLPFKLSDILTRKIIKHIEFYSSIVIGVAMVLFLLYYKLIFIIILVSTGSPLSAFAGLFIFGLCGWFNLHYAAFCSKTSGILRYLMNRKQLVTLELSRQELTSLINKF